MQNEQTNFSTTPLRQRPHVDDESLIGLMDLMPVAAGWLDLDGTCRHVNTAFVDMFGYTLNDLAHVEEWFTKAYPDPDYRASVIEWYAEHITALKSGSTPPALKVSITCKNHSTKHVIINSRVTNERIIGIYTDITDLETIQQELAESEEMFRLSFDHAKDAIFWANVETGILVNCNQAASEMMETPRNEIIGKHQTMLHPPEMAELAACLFNQNTSESYSGLDTKTVVITKSGKRIPVEVKHSVTRIFGVDIIQGIFRDISNQIQVENALRDAHTVLQKTLDSLDEAVFIVETGTRIILDVNTAVEKMFSYTREEMIGKTTSCLHIDDLMSQRFGTEMLKAYEETGFYETLFQMRRSDGTIFHSEHYVTPIRDSQGTILRHVCVVRDISERVRAQEQQEKITLELAAILDNSCVGIAMTRDRLFVRTNQRFNEMFGYERDECVGKSVRIVYPCTEVFLHAGEAITPVIRQGLQYETELQLVRKNGTAFWARYYGKAIDPTDISAGTIWIVEDISIRKTMEISLSEKTRLLKDLNNNLEQRVQLAIHDLRQKEQLLSKQARLLVELAPDAILVVDAEKGKIINANPHAEELFGCSRSELFERSPVEFYNQHQPDGLPPEVSFAENMKVVLSGEALLIERAITTMQGQECICEVRLIRMPSEDGALIRASFTDITERTRKQTELSQALELARSNLEEQKQFIGLISHELRTPLAIIDGAAQLLILTACEDSACRSHSERIRAATRRITDLVDTCLTEERIAAHGWEPEMYAERIHRIVHDVVEKIQATSEKHPIDLDISTLPSHCSCDASMINIMIINLLENAIKYTPDGGTISLRGWSENSGEIRFQVTDQGIGFAPELSDRIFDRYYRTWDLSGIPGAGLGLYLVKRIAQIHGGDAEATSTPGIGSTFTVWIRSDS